MCARKLHSGDTLMFQTKKAIWKAQIVIKAGGTTSKMQRKYSIAFTNVVLESKF